MDVVIPIWFFGFIGDGNDIEIAHAFSKDVFCDLMTIVRIEKRRDQKPCLVIICFEELPHISRVLFIIRQTFSKDNWPTSIDCLFRSVQYAPLHPLDIDLDESNLFKAKRIDSNLLHIIAWHCLVVKPSASGVG